MTPHIFRKYAGHNPNEIKCWSPSSVIDTTSFNIENIVFTRGASKAGTSIPSPLARLEMFDTAFQIVATDQFDNLEGNTIYHQLVSDCLDLIQMLFNTKTTDIGPGKKIFFKEWKVKENIENLKSKGETHPHYLLGHSLEQIFLDQNNPAYYFTESIFLIYYENKLVGGTSPLTLFFTSPNWSRYINEGIIINIPQSSDGDVYFDGQYQSLGKRDKSFVEYLYKLYLSNRTGFNHASGLVKYINRTIDIHYPDWRHKFTELQKASAAEADKTGDQQHPLNLMDKEFGKIPTDIGNKFLTVNGIFFYQQPEGKERAKIIACSDFIIRATETKYDTQYDNGAQVKIDPPLVLVDGMNIPGNYMDYDAPWDPNSRIRDFYHRSIPLHERKLPQGNSLTVTYPFLTTEDFLEESLIEMPFKLNTAKFFTGFRGDCKYLLPIKKEYFNFFNITDLRNNCTILVNDNQVTVALKVPIKNRKGVQDITFSRTYEKSKGNIIECRAGMGIFPFYQVNDPDKHLQVLNDYTILLAERNDKINLNSLRFYSFKDLATDGSDIPAQVTNRSSNSDINSGDATATSRYYRIKQAFDYMELSYQDANDRSYRGLVIPAFDLRTYNKDNLTRAHIFAIDFGTSNTHISYMDKADAISKPFEIYESDQQMVLLNAPGEDRDLSIKFNQYGMFANIDLVLRKEFVPPVIAQKNNAPISFPFKSATCEIASFNNTDKTKADLFSHINIGFYIDQEKKKADDTISGNNIYTTNLKWLLENNNNDANKSRVKLFLKQLLIHIKSKSILNNGKPGNLQIVWSVPLSMKRGSKTLLKSILKDAFKEVFENCGATLTDPIPESIAPYFFLTKSDADIQSTANTINIDIGGGTTDVMMIMESSGNRSDKYLATSFRFAGGDIWGSGYKNKLKDNGFIRNYLAYQKANNIFPNECAYFNKVKDDSNLSSDDLVSLLFRYDDQFRFSDSITIGNSDLALVLYLHYSAIIYHIAQIIELKKYPLPRYISFTGKGSQYLKLICGGDETELEEYTKLLFKSYTGQKTQSSFKIHLNANPKEITANGAVLFTLADEEEKDKYKGDFEFIHPGFDPVKDKELANRIIEGEKKDIYINEAQAIDSPLNIGVLNNLNNFLERTLNDRDIIDFLSGFKIKNLKQAFAALKWTGDIFNGEGFVYDSYKKVLNDLLKEDMESPLPESLFFYAFKDTLYRLSKNIIENKQPSLT
jgi:hypothetical protein